MRGGRAFGLGLVAQLGEALPGDGKLIARHGAAQPFDLFGTERSATRTASSRTLTFPEVPGTWYSAESGWRLLDGPYGYSSTRKSLMT